MLGSLYLLMAIMLVAGTLMARRGKFAPTEIRFTPWDSREFEVMDPFGNQLRFWENNPPGVAR